MGSDSVFFGVDQRVSEMVQLTFLGDIGVKLP